MASRSTQLLLPSMVVVVLHLWRGHGSDNAELHAGRQAQAIRNSGGRSTLSCRLHTEER